MHSSACPTPVAEAAGARTQLTGGVGALAIALLVAGVRAAEGPAEHGAGRGGGRGRSGDGRRDVRRGDGPDVAHGYTFPALIASERLVAERPDDAAAAVRAVVKTQQALRADPSLAVGAARRIFPPEETELIGALVGRDSPFFDPTVSTDAIDRACRFAQYIGQLTAPLPYEQVVATQFQHLWTASP